MAAGCRGVGALFGGAAQNRELRRVLSYRGLAAARLALVTSAGNLVGCAFHHRLCNSTTLCLHESIVLTFMVCEEHVIQAEMLPASSHLFLHRLRRLGLLQLSPHQRAPLVLDLRPQLPDK